MVAEYKPTNDNQNNTTIRKSDLVREWCEKTSLVMNKLYPTIFSETYSLLENESEPWNIDTTNLTIDLSKDHKQTANETNYSFKTCLSNDVEISGIQRLERTIDKTSTQTKQRYSVYENFSLPGSPKITHKNYNTKTSLKKSKRNDELSNKMQNLTLESNILTDDASVLDKAMAVVQNRTNEWLSSCSDVLETRACNTRRSSASSGVSSNYSGGNIVIANVHEEYKYEDKDEGVILIEKRLLLSPVV